MYYHNICRSIRYEKDVFSCSKRNRLLRLLVQGRRNNSGSSSGCTSHFICNDYYIQNKTITNRCNSIGLLSPLSYCNNKNNNHYIRSSSSSSSDNETTKKKEAKKKSGNDDDDIVDPYPNVEVTFNEDYESETRHNIKGVEEEELQKALLAASENNDINIDDYTKEVIMKMPDFDNEPGKVVKWYKNEGDYIQRGDLICDIKIESLSFTFGITSDDEGITIMGKQNIIENHTELLNSNDPMCITFHKPLLPKTNDEDKKQEE